MSLETDKVTFEAFRGTKTQARKVGRELLSHSFKKTKIESSLTNEAFNFEDRSGTKVAILTISEQDDEYWIISDRGAAPIIHDSDSGIKRL